MHRQSVAVFDRFLSALSSILTKAEAQCEAKKYKPEVILADRLKKLVAEGILAKCAYEERPLRYEYRLTAAGRALHPVIMAIVHWGDTHRVTRKGRPLLHTHKTCGHDFDPVMVCSHCAAPLSARAVTVRAGPGATPSMSTDQDQA